MFDVLCETLREICNRWGYEWPGGEWQIRAFVMQDGEQCWVLRSPVIWTPSSNMT